MSNLLKILLHSNYLNVFAYSLFGPLYALYVVQVGGSAFHVGATWSMYMFITGISMIYLSKIADKSDRNKKVMIVSGYFILSIGAFMFAFVQNTTQIYLVQMLNAFGVGLLNPSWKAMYSKLEDKGKEAQEWASFDGGNTILTAMAALMGGLFITYFSFQSLFLIISAIQLFAALISLKILQK